MADGDADSRDQHSGGSATDSPTRLDEGPRGRYAPLRLARWRALSGPSCLGRLGGHPEPSGRARTTSRPLTMSLGSSTSRRKSSHPPGRAPRRPARRGLRLLARAAPAPCARGLRTAGALQRLHLRVLVEGRTSLLIPARSLSRAASSCHSLGNALELPHPVLELDTRAGREVSHDARRCA